MRCIENHAAFFMYKHKNFKNESWGEGGHKLQKGGFDFSPSKLNDYI